MRGVEGRHSSAAGRNAIAANVDLALGHAARLATGAEPRLADPWSEREVEVEVLAGFKLSERQLSLRGKHPALGSVTLGELLASWVVHDLSHINQVCRAMARQYDGAVGPWKAYMGILNAA